MKDGLVRADTLPLVFKALGCESLPRGAHVRVRITGTRPADARACTPACSRAWTTPRAAADADRRDRSRGRRRGRAGRARAGDRRCRTATRRADAAGGPHAAARTDGAGWLDAAHHAALGAARLAGACTRAADGALRRPRALQPHVPGHAARGDPGQRPLATSAPTKAQAIAQANLAGGGEAERGRATSPLPPSATVELGDSTEDARRQIEQLQEQQQQLLAQIRRELALLPPPDPQRDAGTPEERDAGRAPPPAAAAAGRDREAHQRRERAAEEALHQPGHARGGLRASTTTRCAAGSRSAARATSPSTRARSCTAS